MQPISNTQPRVSNARGFTIIELIIVVTIIGLLSIFAYPSYLDHVRRSNRNDARAALTRVANDLERFFATNNAYTTDMSDLSLNMTGGAAYSENGHYTVSVAAGPTGDITTSYQITATAVAGGAQATDEHCQSLTLNSQGVRTPDPATQPCW